MSTQRRSRKDKQHAHSAPYNYTCGVCKQVHKFDPKISYLCTNALFITAEEFKDRNP